MKKLLTIAFGVAAVSAMAFEATIGGVGVRAFTCPAGSRINLMAVTFDDLYSGSENISVSNLVLTSGLAVGDELCIFDGAKYYGFKLVDNDGVKNWSKIAKNITKTAEGLLESDGVAPDTTTKTVGQGFCIIRKDATDSLKVYAYGKPPTNETIRVELATGVRTLCGNPLAVEKFPDITGADGGDVIQFPDPSGAGFYRAEYDGNNWVWNKGEDDDHVIPANGGFWYKAGTGSAPVLNWSEQ